MLGGEVYSFSAGKTIIKCRNKDVVGVAAQGPGVDISALGQVDVRKGGHMYWAPTLCPKCLVITDVQEWRKILSTSLTAKILLGTELAVYRASTAGNEQGECPLGGRRSRRESSGRSWARNDVSWRCVHLIRLRMPSLAFVQSFHRLEASPHPCKLRKSP